MLFVVGCVLFVLDVSSVVGAWLFCVCVLVFVSFLFLLLLVCPGLFFFLLCMYVCMYV